MTASVYRADAVDGLQDGLPSREYRQEAPFWVFVALQDWLRDEGNLNLLEYDTSSSVRSFPYPTRDDGQRLTPREVFYLFRNPPAAIAAQLPHCYCVVLQDDSPVLVRSFTVRKDDSPRFGEYGLTCASRRNRCGYFAWLSDIHAASELETARASTAMLDHIRHAQCNDTQKVANLASKKRAFRPSRSTRSGSGYSSGEAGLSAAYSSEPDDIAGVAPRVQPWGGPSGASSGLLGVHGQSSEQTGNKRAARAQPSDSQDETEGAATKRRRTLAPARGAPAAEVVAAPAQPPAPPTVLPELTRTGQHSTPPSVNAERPGSEFLWALTETGADETAWDRAARRLTFCCGRVWEQFAITKHKCDDLEASETSRIRDPDADAELLALRLLDPPGVLFEDWHTAAASMKRCCGRVWAPRIFNRVHSPCPNNAISIDD